MAGLVWDKVGDRTFEVGVSKGVLYQENRVGIPWNGLTSVEESNNNSSEPVYFDGVKFNDIVTLGEYVATMRAVTYPEGFLIYEGNVESQSGFYITNQPPGKFGLSYQTRVGDDVSGLGKGYKIHILYNLTALPTQRTFETISDSLDPVEFEWEITSIPEDVDNFRPTSHVILDSRKLDPNMLIDIESILYGSADNDAYLPSLQGFSTFIRKWNRLIITDNGDGTWTATTSVEDLITMINSTTFEIDAGNSAVYLDADTYEISSSQKNEEDIWLA